MYVSSETKFNHFEYDHMTYKYVASRMKEGVVEAKNTTGVRITDIERSVVDSVKDFNKIGGFEELLNCLEGIHYLDEKRLVKYLDIYNIQGLYQRVGYLLGHYRKDMQKVCIKGLNIFTKILKVLPPLDRIISGVFLIGKKIKV